MRLARALRLVWSVVLFCGVVGFVVANQQDLTKGLVNGVDLRFTPVTAGLVLSCLGMLNRASKSRASHRAVGLEVPAWSMLAPTMIGFSADKVVRFGGLSGLAVMMRHGDRVGYAKPLVLASTVVAKVANTMSLGVILVVASVLLGLKGSLDRWWLAVGGGFVVYVAFVAAVLLVMAKNRDLAERCWSRVAERAPRACRSLGGQEPVAAIAAGLRRARTNRGRTAQVVVHATLAKMVGVGLLAASSHAVGVPLEPTDVFVVYATVLLASLASITPGGVGAVEASAVAIIVGIGTQLPDAVAVAAVFRLLDLWLPLAVGGVAAAVGKCRRRLVASAATSGGQFVPSPSEQERTGAEVNYCS